MKFERRIVYGERARSDWMKIVRDLKHSRVRPYTYVIVKKDDSGRMEMYHNASFLKYPARVCGYTVIGVAEGRTEGLEVIRKLVAADYGTE